MNPVSLGIVCAGLALQLVLQACLLLGGHLRRYPFLMAYSLVFVVTTVAEVIVVNASGTKSVAYRYLYMADEAILDLLLFVLVIGMTYRALAGNPLRAKIERLLKITLIATLVLPFILFRSPVLGPRWFNETSQLLNFGAAIMNLGLWTALLGNKNRDPIVLAVSAGLGVAVTGAAVTYGLHHFHWSTNKTARELVDLIKSLAYVASLLIWCRAFWPVRLASADPAVAPSIVMYP